MSPLPKWGRRVTAALALLWFGIGAAPAENAWTASYPEGPVWFGETLYWAEMSADKVMQWTGGTDGTDDTPSVAFERKGCGPTAIARFGKDDILVLCHLEGALLHLGPDWTLIGTFSATPDGTKLRNPNDASADGRGGVWFTDPGRFSKTAEAEGRLYHISADGKITLHRDGLFYGNGVHVDASNARLLVSEHLARRVLAFPLADGELAEPEVLIDLDTLGLPAPRYREAGPDGLEIGSDGTLWFAEYGSGRLLGWQDGKGLVAALAVDAQFVTNVAFSADGQAAMTGAKDNQYFPFPGAVWAFDYDILKAAISQ